MNLHALLQDRARDNNPVKVGDIGAGKSSTIFISQARFTAGTQIAGITELDPEKARRACLRTGRSADNLSFENSTAAINDTARRKKTAITENATAVVAAGDYKAQMFNSFLDGTKSAIEMWAVSNASGLVPQKNGLQFPPVSTGNLKDTLKYSSEGGILEHSGTVEVIACENRDGSPVANDLRWGVYVVFKAPTAYVKRCFAEYGLLTDATGQYSAVSRPYHLIGLELAISIASADLRNEATGPSKDLIAGVAAAAKRDPNAGEVLDGKGGFTVYGRLVPAEDSLQNAYLPMGLAGSARLKRPVAKDAVLTYADVELDENLLSFTLRKSMEKEKRKGIPQ